MRTNITSSTSVSTTPPSADQRQQLLSSAKAEMSQALGLMNEKLSPKDAIDLTRLLLASAGKSTDKLVAGEFGQHLLQRLAQISDRAERFALSADCCPRLERAGLKEDAAQLFQTLKDTASQNPSSNALAQRLELCSAQLFAAQGEGQQALASLQRLESQREEQGLPSPKDPWHAAAPARASADQHYQQLGLEQVATGDYIGALSTAASVESGYQRSRIILDAALGLKKGGRLELDACHKVLALCEAGADFVKAEQDYPEEARGMQLAALALAGKPWEEIQEALREARHADLTVDVTHIAEAYIALGEVRKAIELRPVDNLYLAHHIDCALAINALDQARTIVARGMIDNIRKNAESSDWEADFADALVAAGHLKPALDIYRSLLAAASKLPEGFQTVDLQLSIGWKLYALEAEPAPDMEGRFLPDYLDKKLLHEEIEARTARAQRLLARVQPEQASATAGSQGLDQASVSP